MTRTQLSGWFCSHCKTGVDPREVTFSETHTVCGRVISGDEPTMSTLLEDLDNAKAVIDQMVAEKAEHKALIKQLVADLNCLVADHDTGRGVSLAGVGHARDTLKAAKDAGF